MDVLADLAELEENDGFVRRHIGPSESELAAMLHAIGAATLDDVAGKTVPASIRSNSALDLPPPIDEAAAIAELRALAARNAPEKIADRHGLPRHGHAAGHPAQRAGKSRLVHGLHAVPGGDRPGPPGSAAEFPDHDLRADGHADRQRLAFGRGDRRGRGDGDGTRFGQDQIQRAGGGGRRASADAGGAGDPGEARSASL